MAPLPNVELVIIELRYMSHRLPLYPEIMTRWGSSVSHYLDEVKDWFDQVMSKELPKVPSNLDVLYREWNIKSGNADLFTINGYCFTNIRILFGQEGAIYWLYYSMPGYRRHIEGHCHSLSLTYCACCLSRQYLKIMEAIKQYVISKIGNTFP